MTRKCLNLIFGVTFPYSSLFSSGRSFEKAGIDWPIASSQREFRVDGRELSIQGAGFHPDANFRTLATIEAGANGIHPHHTIDGEERLYCCLRSCVHVSLLAGREAAILDRGF